MKTSEKLKIARKGKGLTQKELALKVGAAQATINKIERDEIKNPSFDLAVKIANVLGKNVFELFSDESQENQHSNLSEKEIDRMKVLVFHSLDRYESMEIFFKQFEYNEQDPEEWKKFEEYRTFLAEFKKGVLEKLIEVGFCSQEDIKDYRTYIYKQANERMFAKKTSAQFKQGVSESALLSDEVSEEQLEEEKLRVKSDPNYIPERFKTDDGRPFIRENVASIPTFKHPDHLLHEKEAEETIQIMREISETKNTDKSELGKISDKPTYAKNK